MLNKRFKIAKCKTSLKLATSRIKLMKNKKEIQIHQMKKELAQLLESGQDRTARIRVEHVIREEKMKAAYELLEIYCELIVARLPIIESQKTCPIDLKEAITSVIFASPRCSDIPELDDAKKNFTAKYGKEFASAALELRPDSGVNRMMVEKLSAVAPDLQSKMKVLSAVAKEHNVNWDPTLFEEIESKPSNDLLNGPVNFEKVSMMNVDSPKIQTSNVQKVYTNEEKLNVPDDFSMQNRRYTLSSTQNIITIDTNPSGMASEMMNRRHSFHNNIHNSSSGRENNWNMDFKDATSAAQAAAESAERASMAARAAAQLSRQYSSESNKSHNRDETPQVPTPSEFHGQKPKIQSPQTDPWKHDTSPKATKEVIRKQPSGSGSSLSRSSTMSDEQKVGKKTVVDQQDHSRETKKTSSYSDYHRDDETDSDDEYPKFDTVFEYDEGEAKSFFPSPGREESIRPIENPHIWSQIKNMAELNSRKTRIELNDLVEKGSSVYKSENEVKKVQSEQFSKVSLRHERKNNNVEPQVVEKDTNFLSQDDDMDTGKEFKFGTLTGGIRNKGGLNYPPYRKTGIADSLTSPKKLVDQTSKSSSFESRRSGIGKKGPSVYMSNSETESESEDGGDKFFKNRSQFAPPDVMFNNDIGISDSDEEVVPVSKPTPARLSRRTKDHIEPKGKTVISWSSMHPSTNESSPTKKISEQPPKTSNLSSQISLEANKAKNPSHVHPNLPEYDSLAARIQSLQKK